MKISEDKLNRKGLVVSLFKFFDNFVCQSGKGLTMVLNGKYGTGKSTLLNFIEDYNSNNDYEIIKYDAWENNLFENPLIPILYSISKIEKTNSKIKEKAKNIVKNIPKTLFSTVSNITNIDVQQLFNNENIFEEYDKYKDSIEKFKQVLIEFCSNNKTIILVDELDRCLPEYQIKVLESLFHFHDIPNLIILIALDKTQLESSIKTKFGKNLNIHGYLSKFIQYKVDLPHDGTYEYIISLMKFNISRNEDYAAKKALAYTLKSINLPVRECIILIERLNLLLGEIKTYTYYYPIIAGVLLLLKHTDNDVYKMFFSKQRDYLQVKNEYIKLSETLFNVFIEKIKDTEFEKVMDYWISNEGYGHSLMIHFINLFYSVNKISPESIGEYLNTAPENITYRLTIHENLMFPTTVNSLINKIDLLI